MMETKSEIAESHRVRGWTNEQRIAWFGMSAECREGRHAECNTWNGRTHRSGYDVVRYPCACPGHFEGS